jgi:hypothetical protein
VARPCNAPPLDSGGTPVLSAIRWITDSTTEQNILFIAKYQRLQRRSRYISL